MKEKIAQNILKKTKDDYNIIAAKFSSTRQYLPNDITVLKKYVKNNDKILDLGCGNGRLVKLFYGLKIDYIGIDVSKKLLKIATQKYPNYKFLQFNGLKLPFKKESFDNVYCLAVFHHIPSEKYRLKFLSEIYRVLKPNGLLILTVWNLSDKLKILNNKIHSDLDKNDIYYPFKNHENKIIINRYLHSFTVRELTDLAEKTDFKILENYSLKRGKSGKNSNIIIICQKT